MRPLLLPLGLTALLCLLPALAPADNSVPQLPAPEGAQCTSSRRRMAPASARPLP